MTVWIRIDQGICVAALLTLVGSGVALPAPLVRAAASEDAHNVATLLALITLVAADGIRRAHRSSRLQRVLFVAAAVATLYARQTVVYWPALALWAMSDDARAAARSP